LVDWCVRESFHVLEYLNHQRFDREAYEIIWLELYDRRPKEIEALIKRYEDLGLPSPIDTWILMDYSRTEYYHKHRMYNLGILHSSGQVVTILDSDTILKTTFVEAIVREFEKQKSLVLHLEQIRNFDKKYYPFNYPSIDEIIGEGCVNAINGIPTGFDKNPKSLKRDWNLWHVYNYGACFCANREDLIYIGGADEHEDYLGHICGPYEMTARLINAGVPDRLHPTEWSYHVWHPNTAGENNNYWGPNNGKGMSTTALEIALTGRVMPLIENEEIKKLRLTLTRSQENIVQINQ